MKESPLLVCVDEIPELGLHGEADERDDDVPALANQDEHGTRYVPDV